MEGSADERPALIQGAVEDAGEVVRLRPNDPEAFRLRAEALAAAGNADEARRDRETAEKLSK